MDYVFNEKIFKETFNVQEPDTKSQDVYRLRHNPNKKFKLFPYKANGKIHIVYEMEEIISDFFKLALGIETEDILMDDLCQKMRKKLAIVPGRNSNYINSSRGNNVGNFMPNSL